jgi:5-bromo-4-chloroindolyl phosphate hydrolysis protein
MLRIDKRTPDEIEAVIRFCQADDFWCSNILSTKKLREKFTALLAKMNGKSARPKLDRIAEHNLAVVSEFLSRGDD